MERENATHGGQDLMNRINEFEFEPGPYKHYKGGIYVATDIVTHMDNETTGKMEPLEDPLVVYRDVTAPVRHVKGRPQTAHQVYARKLSEFKSMVDNNGTLIKRFTKM